MQTQLTLSVGGLPPLSARGCVQELKPIPQGEFVRTLQGDLVFIGNPRHKYRSTIRCMDENILATNGLTIGQDVTIGCIQRLCQKVDPTLAAISLPLERPPVEETLVVLDAAKQPFEAFRLDGSTLHIEPHDQDLFVFYAPRLHMRLMSFTFSTDEWKLRASWTLEFEEI